MSINVTLQNTGTAALSAWSLTWHFPDTTQNFGSGWSANWSQTGTLVTATNLSWNGTIAPGGSTGIGFNGTWTTADPIPTDFAVNGAACAGPDTPPVVSLTAPTSGQHFTAPATVTLSASASDPDVGDSISKVEFYHDGLLLNTDTAAPYTFAWTSVPAGSYSIQAQAYDTKGDSTLSAPVPIVVDAEHGARRARDGDAGLGAAGRKRDRRGPAVDGADGERHRQRDRRDHR